MPSRGLKKSVVPTNKPSLIPSTLLISVPGGESFLESVDQKTDAAVERSIRILGKCALLGFAGFGVLAAIYIFMRKLLG